MRIFQVASSRCMASHTPSRGLVEATEPARAAALFGRLLDADDRLLLLDELEVEPLIAVGHDLLRAGREPGLEQLNVDRFVALLHAHIDRGLAALLAANDDLHAL